MKKLIFVLFLFVFLAFGQKAETVKMDRHAATQAWATVNFPLPLDTPSITGGGIVVERETNGAGYKLWVVYSMPGTYLMVGQSCDGGDELKLGELYWEPNPYNQIGSAVVFDSIALNSALPFFSQVCAVGLLRVDKGRIERSVVETNPWRKSAASPFPVGSEGVAPNGRYFLALLSLPADAVVILGRGVIAEGIQRSPTGSIAVFPQVGMPPLGPTTITVCTRGHCGTTTFERKVEMPSSHGKG